ncbi:MAG: sulfotransferase [Bacteroidia bacterium]|nr:sulfotransferase [Bacteroidia bacterium]
MGTIAAALPFFTNMLGKDPQFAYCTTYEGVLPHIFLTAGGLTRTILQAAMPSTRPQDNVRAGANLPIEEEFALGNISNASFVHGLYFPNDLYEVFDRVVTFKGGPQQAMEWQASMMYLSQKLALKNPGKVLLLKSPSNTARVKEILEVYPDARFIHIYRNPYDVYRSTVGLFEKILPIVGLQRTTPGHMSDFVLYKYEQIHRKYLAERHLIPAGRLYE